MDWKESIELKGLNEVLEFIEFRGPVWGVRIGVQVGGRGSRPMEVGGPVLGVPYWGSRFGGPFWRPESWGPYWGVPFWGPNPGFCRILGFLWIPGVP